MAGPRGDRTRVARRARRLGAGRGGGAGAGSARRGSWTASGGGCATPGRDRGRRSPDRGSRPGEYRPEGGRCLRPPAARCPQETRRSRRQARGPDRERARLGGHGIPQPQGLLHGTPRHVAERVPTAGLARAPDVRTPVPAGCPVVRSAHVFEGPPRGPGCDARDRGRPDRQGRRNDLAAAAATGHRARTAKEPGAGDPSPLGAEGRDRDGRRRDRLCTAMVCSRRTADRRRRGSCGRRRPLPGAMVEAPPQPTAQSPHGSLPPQRRSLRGSGMFAPRPARAPHPVPVTWRHGCPLEHDASLRSPPPARRSHGPPEGRGPRGRASHVAVRQRRDLGDRGQRQRPERRRRGGSRLRGPAAPLWRAPVTPAAAPSCPQARGGGGCARRSGGATRTACSSSGGGGTGSR